MWVCGYVGMWVGERKEDSVRMPWQPEPSLELRLDAAFSLIELLVVTAIIGVVVAAIGACLAGGIRVWDSARTFNETEAETLVAFRLMRKDLANTFRFPGIPLTGDGEQLEMAGVQVSPPEPGADEALTGRVGAIAYRWDRSGRTWLREWIPFAWDESDLRRTLTEVLVRDVRGVALQYAAAPEAGGGELRWAEAWSNPTNLPVAVQVELSVGSRRSGRCGQVFLLENAGAAAP